MLELLYYYIYTQRLQNYFEGHFMYVYISHGMKR